MKKTYINPNLEVVRLQMSQHLLDGSLTRTNTEASVNGEGEYTNDLGRYGDLDDDF